MIQGAGGLNPSVVWITQLAILYYWLRDRTHELGGFASELRFDEIYVSCTCVARNRN